MVSIYIFLCHQRNIINVSPPCFSDILTQVQAEGFNYETVPDCAYRESSLSFDSRFFLSFSFLQMRKKNREQGKIFFCMKMKRKSSMKHNDSCIHLLCFSLSISSVYIHIKFLSSIWVTATKRNEFFKCK